MGFEAIDVRDCAIGMFMSQREAAAALQQVEMKSTFAPNRTQASQFSQRHRRYLSPTSLAARRILKQSVDSNKVLGGKFATSSGPDFICRLTSPDLIPGPTKRFDINYFFFANSSCRFFCVSFFGQSAVAPF